MFGAENQAPHLVSSGSLSGLDFHSRCELSNFRGAVGQVGRVGLLRGFDCAHHLNVIDRIRSGTPISVGFPDAM